MKITYCASEGLPFSKSGGLGDVIGTLPKTIAELDKEVSVFLPLYKTTKDNFITKLEFLNDFTVYVNNSEKFVGLWTMKYNNVDYYFIENDQYFYRDNLYGYDDDGERFSFYQKAILESFAQLNSYPDVLHTNDWHTAMLPFLCKEVYKGKYLDIKHIFTIHNIKFQGKFDPILLESCLTVPYHYYETGDLKHDELLNFMKSAINYSDIITTVSDTYSKEILTDEFGEGLQYPLRYRVESLYGIVNGIDIVDFSTTTSKDLYHNYGITNFRLGKKENKVKLQEELNLEVNKKTCLVSLISRLTDQKGLDILINSLDELLNKDIQLVVLGTGEQQYEDTLRYYSHNYSNFVFINEYNETLARKIYAASDLFLMPSLFEPCGLSQLIAMNHGTLPIVRETGGLVDTVTPYNKYTSKGTGFTFSEKNQHSFLEVFNIAYELYYEDKTTFNSLVKEAMKQDYSFKNSANRYLDLYTKLVTS